MSLGFSHNRTHFIEIICWVKTSSGIFKETNITTKQTEFSTWGMTHLLTFTFLSRGAIAAVCLFMVALDLSNPTQCRNFYRVWAWWGVDYQKIHHSCNVGGISAHHDRECHRVDQVDLSPVNPTSGIWNYTKQDFSIPNFLKAEKFMMSIELLLSTKIIFMPKLAIYMVATRASLCDKTTPFISSSMNVMGSSVTFSFFLWGNLARYMWCL